MTTHAPSALPTSSSSAKHAETEARRPDLDRALDSAACEADIGSFAVDVAAHGLATALVEVRGAPSTWRSAPHRTGLASAIIDAVMSPRVPTSTVDAVVARYEHLVGEASDVPDLLASFDHLDPTGWRELIGTNHRVFARIDAPYKADVIAAAAGCLAEHGVTTSAELHARAHDGDLRAAWCALPGQSSGAGWRHLLLVSGYGQMVLCPLTRRWAGRFLPRELTEPAALRVVIAAVAADLDTSAFDVEHQMWRAAVSPK